MESEKNRKIPAPPKSQLVHVLCNSLWVRGSGFVDVNSRFLRIFLYKLCFGVWRTFPVKIIFKQCAVNIGCEMDCVIKHVYELKAYLVRRNAEAEPEFHDRRIGFYTSRDMVEKVVKEQINECGSLLDTNTRKLSYFELTAYEVDSACSKVVESKVYDRWGGLLAG